MTNEQLKDQIDADITNKTVENSITPTIVGDNLKDIVDYIDQENDTIINLIGTEDKTSGVFTAVSNAAVNSGSGILPYDFTKVNIGVETNNYVAIIGDTDEFGKVYTVTNNDTNTNLIIKFKNNTKYLSEDGITYLTDYTLPFSHTVSFTYAELDGIAKIYYVSVVKRTSFEPVIDDTPIENSTNLVTSGGVFAAIDSTINETNLVHKSEDETITGIKTFTNAVNATAFVTSTGTSNQCVTGVGSLRDVYNANYLPTASVLTNITSVSFINASYFKIGNLVTVSIGFQIIPTAANAATSFQFNLPINKALTASTNGGNGTYHDGTAPINSTPVICQVHDTYVANFAYVKSTNTHQCNIRFTYDITQ